MESSQRDKMILDNIGLVHKACRDVKVLTNLYEDYLQEGIIGLVEAVDKFDESKGFQFSTFAYPHIKCKILQYARDKSRTVRLPRSLWYKKMEYNGLVNKGLTEEQIREKLNVSEPDWFNILNDGVASLDYVDEDSGITRYDTVGEEDNLDEVFYYNVDITLKYILRNERQHVKDIYEEHIFSILYDKPVSQQYLSAKYRVSQPQISRIINKYNKILKELL